MTAINENNLNHTLKQLEFDILSGYFKPREHLIEKDLCERYNASRGTVRKVLQELEFKHIIRHFSNRGSTVAEPTKKEMEDIYNTRVLLENYAIDLLVGNIDKLDLARLIEYHSVFEKAVEAEDLKGIMESNRLFHQEIFQVCDNAIVLELIDQLRKRSHVWQHYIVGHADRLRKTVAEHDAIVDCLKKHDASGLKMVNENHLTMGFKSYMEDLMIAHA
jgi:DNA-binding GntR family transcriptional regulator